MKKIVLLPVICCTFGFSLAQPTAPFSSDQYTIALWHFDEGTGDSVYDASGHGNHGKMYGTQWTAGKFGTALSFNGTDSVKILDNPSLHVQNVTVEAWVYSDNYTLSPYGVFVTKEYGNMASYRLQNYSTTSKVGFVTNAQWNHDLISPQPLTVGEWHYVAGVASNGFFKIYIDGTLAASAPRSFTLSYDDSPLLIGAVRYISTACFRGKIDEVRISSIDRFTGTMPGIVAYWSFDSVAGNTYFDVSGNGYNAVATGTGISAAAGVVGNSLGCTGGGFGVTVQNSQSDFYTPRYSVEFLYYCDLDLVTQIPNGQYIFGYQNIQSGTYNGYGIYVNNHGYLDFGQAVAAGNDYVNIFSQQPLKGKTWYHIVATYDSLQMRLYINGKLEAAASNPGGYPPPNDVAQIGFQKKSDGIVQWWVQGKIDEIKYYSNAIDGATIAQHYAGYNIDSANNVQTSNMLVASWSFDADAGKTFFDATGHGYTAMGSGEFLRTVDGVLGNALECEDSAFDIAVSNSAGNFNLQKFTIEGWFYSYVNMVNPGLFFNYKTIFSNQKVGLEGSGIRGGYAVQINDSGKILFGIADPVLQNWSCVYGDSLILPNRWYHCAATCDGSNIKFYLNGRMTGQKSSPNGIVSCDVPARIGCQYQLTGASTGRARQFFNGKIDELKLYNYAIDAPTVLEHYNQLKPGDRRRFKINFGMKTTFCNPGDTVWVPIYLTNFENFVFNACQFSIVIDTSKLRLLTMSKDSSMIRNWPLFQWNPKNGAEIHVAAAGTADTVGYGEGEFIRCRFAVKPSKKQTDTAVIGMSDILFDEGKSGKILVVPSVVPGKIIFPGPGILYGDVTGDRAVTVFDARDILSYVVGLIKLPDPANHPNFTVAVADVSGNGTVTSYDAALVFQYSLGMISEFPVMTSGGLNKQLEAAKAPPPAILGISLASQSPTDGMKFNISGTNLNGFVAGEFAIAYDTAISNIGKGVINTALRSANLYSRLDKTAHLVKIALTTNDDIHTGDPVVLATIILPPNSTKNPASAFTFETALINEGKIPAIISRTVSLHHETSPAIPAVCDVRYLNQALLLRSTAKQPVRVRLFTINGRSMTNILVSAQEAGQITVPLSRYGTGAFIYRVTAGNATVKTGRAVNGK